VFVIKADIPALRKTLQFTAQETMYGGKNIAKGDVVFLVASENEGGRGLIARGIVSTAEPIPKESSLARQTPRVSVLINDIEPAKRPLGRSELKRFSNWETKSPGYPTRLPSF
jgi:hypothetical protein